MDSANASAMSYNGGDLISAYCLMLLQVFAAEQRQQQAWASASSPAARRRPTTASIDDAGGHRRAHRQGNCALDANLTNDASSAAASTPNSRTPATWPLRRGAQDAAYWVNLIEVSVSPCTAALELDGLELRERPLRRAQPRNHRTGTCTRWAVTGGGVDGGLIGVFEVVVPAERRHALLKPGIQRPGTRACRSRSWSRLINCRVTVCW